MASRKSAKVGLTSLPGRTQQAYILFASFVTGTTILVVEILGTRVISPYYGSSVYVWSSLISVTLAALTVGYAWGGKIADRHPSLVYLSAEIIIGGLLVFAIPFVRTAVLSVTTPAGLKMGSFASAFLLFFLPLVALSMTGPLAIRLVTSEFTLLGRGIGKIYGVSTLGSLMGAIITGFYLIPNFSVRMNLFCSAAVLVCLGCLGLFISKRPLSGVVGGVSAVALAFLLAQTPALASRIVYLKNSFYGELKVVDLDENVRYLMVNGAIQGEVDKHNMEPLSSVYQDMGLLPLFHPAAKRALIIGLGPGALPLMLSREYNIISDAVEIDPEILKIAETYFGYKTEGTTSIEDGRTFVERTKDQYDLVVLDAFISEVAPFHLFTQEFFQRVDKILNPGGVFCLNTAGFPYGPESRGWRSTYRTLKSQFEYIRMFKSPDMLPTNPSSHTNIIFLASHEPISPEMETPKLNEFILREITAPLNIHESDAVLLTDDYNPMESLNRSLFISVRQSIIGTEQSVLLFDGYSL